MYYIIYKTINLINGKFYIGKHQTTDLNDGYIGSGKLLKRAIKKYGEFEFKTVILGIFDQEWQMNLAERIYVVIDPEVSYNICVGGQGGFGYINKHKLQNTELALKVRKQNGIDTNRKLGVKRHQIHYDQYERTPKYCPTCSSKIPYIKRMNSFCNSSCSAVYNNEARKNALV